MEKQLSSIIEFRAVLADQVKNLQEQVSQFEGHIMRLADKLGKIDKNLGMAQDCVLQQIQKEPDSDDMTAPPSELKRPFNAPTGGLAKIIPFPGLMEAVDRTDDPHRTNRFSASVPYLAPPGKPLPPEIPDFRAILQRDGLILLSWDMRRTEMGDRYTAYWVNSTGTPRYYASRHLSPEDFPSARPDHKSYAAEDGIEFYGQEAPFYIVHVAPELMMSDPRHVKLRSTHIDMLKRQGSPVDFEYRYLLKTDKNRKPPSKKSGSCSRNQAG